MSVRGTWRLFADLGLFIRHQKKWWLLPIIVTIVLTSVFILLAHTAPGLFPLLYPLI